MSAHMKEHHTSTKSLGRILYVLDHNLVYAIPKSVAKKYIVETKKPIEHEGNISADVVFKDMDKKYGEAGALLRGLRSRENLSQVEFAKKIKVTQANLSKMENGARPIGKIIAMRIAKAFSVNYKYFL
ncbi:MAG: Transcriptional regulator [uncultured bacterium]|nr:MAG: Transcriptional regulator [uncultured bacterium]